MHSRPDSSTHARRAPHTRSFHRARSHDNAHAEPAVHAHQIDPAKYPGVPIGDAEVIATPDRLADLIDELRRIGSFAYDSEFIGELTYIPKLCLIQVATTARIALIDPLAGLDVTSFWELLSEDSIEKIVHAGQQDIEPVVRHLNRQAANVFDTQIAAGFIGLAYPVALNKLVHELIGLKIGKGLTFSHWDQRPLSPMQLRYAADDVRFLPSLRQIMGKRLEETGHAPWAREEFDALCDARLYRFDPDTAYQRVRGATTLPPQAQAILRELVIWRDGAARAHDVPPRAFLKDEILVDLSRSPVKTVEKLDRVRGLPRPVEAAHGAEIVAATHRGLETPSAKLAHPRPEPTPSERFGADALWAAAQCLCIGKSIDPALVTSRQEIGEFYRYLTHSHAREPDLGIQKGWRKAALGDPLRELAKGGKSIHLGWSQGSLRAS
jgi:ribonuclease D